jgi:very-short-patch-repair endonuclease
MQGSRKGITRDGVVCSHLEAALYDQLKAAQLTDGLVREHKFHPIRKWRFDFAWPSQDVAVEVQGGIWLGKRGRHTSGTGMARDIEKSNSAALLGWRLFAYTADMISSGQAVEQLGRVLRYVPSQIRTGEAANQIQRIVDNATKQE